MTRIYLIVLALVASFSFSCTRSHNSQSVKESAVSNNSDGGRAPASVSKVKLQQIKKVRARKMAILNKNTKGFYIPPKFLTSLSKKDRDAYYHGFAMAALDLEKILKKAKPKSAFYKIDIDRLLNELLFPSLDAVTCPNSAWIVDIPGTVCNSSTWNFRPESATNFSSYKPPTRVWADSSTRCEAGVASGGGVTASPKNGMTCPPGGWQIVGSKAYLFCNGNSTGSTGNCLIRFGSSANKREQLRKECNNGGITSVDNLTCAELDASEEAYIRMHTDVCGNASLRGPSGGAVDNICKSLSNNVEEVKKRVVDATEPEPDGDLPNTRSCNELGGEHATERDGMSNHWQAIMQVARRACGGSGGSIDAMAQKYGSCSRSFPGAAGDFEVNNLAETWNPSDKTYIMQFVQQFGFTPKQYSALLCGVNNPGSFVGRLQNAEKYRYGSEKELLTQFDDFAETGAPEAGSIFAGKTNVWPVLRDWYLENNTRVNNQVAGNAALTMKGIKRDLDENETFRNRVAELATSIVDNARTNQTKEQIYSSINAFLDRIEEKDPTRRLKYMAGLSFYFKDHVPPPNHRTRFEQAEKWFNDCAEEVAKKENLGIDDKTGLEVIERKTSSQCRYTRVRDPEYFGRHFDGRTPFIIMDAKSETCFKSEPEDTVMEKRVGDNMVRYTKIKNPTYDDSTLGGEVLFNSTSFRTDTQKTRPYVLFAHQCKNDADVYMPGYTPDGTGETVESVE